MKPLRTKNWPIHPNVLLPPVCRDKSLISVRNVIEDLKRDNKESEEQSNGCQ